ncbi:MAG: glycosyltransferase family 39 protein [Clostridia bacterium]|nr:glycosyltransferase family 39 protein [Clostridia bacterium]
MNRLSSENKNKSVNSLLALLLLTAFSFTVLYICTSSSPRYAINPWVDANAFFTVGKGMAKGMIPYKDLFEQKGPLLYLIHCIAYKISNTSFTGVYVLESLSLTITLFFVYKLAKLCINEKASVLVSVITGVVITNTFALYLGDSAEEFCLPSLAIAIYYLVRFFRNPDSKELKGYTYFICGILAGCVAMIKYSIIGIWFAWMACIALYTLIIKKDVKSAFVNSIIFLIGMGVSFIPWIIYFAANGALKDFIVTYFIINSGSYSRDKTTGILHLLKNVYNRLVIYSLYSEWLSILSFAGVVLASVTRRIFPKKLVPHFVFPAVFICHIFLTYFGTGIAYYHLTFAVFVPLAFIVLFSYFEMLVKDKKIRQAVSITLTAVLCIGVIPFSMYNSTSSKTVHRKTEDTVQYSFSHYITEHNPNAKVLNLGFLDGGFYVMNDTLPPFKHFERQNIPPEKYAENVNEQMRYLNEALADYVIVRQTKEPDEKRNHQYYPTLSKNYSLVKTQQEKIIDVNTKEMTLTFYLYEKNK